MDERRRLAREPFVKASIEALTHRLDGSVLVGRVRDLSSDGVGVTGDTAGLKTGDEVTLTLRFPIAIAQTEAAYQCEIRYVDPGYCFGARFKTVAAVPRTYTHSD